MSAIRLLVLGTIRRQGRAHGYRVLRDLTAWRVDTWTRVKPGSIYHAISQLEAQGYLLAADARPSPKLGPARTEYQLTAEGETEFASLLKAALLAFDIEIHSAGIAFMEMLPRARVIALLQQRQAALQENAAFLKTLPTESIPSEPSKHPALIALWVDYVEGTATTTQNLIQALESGRYVFLHEREIHDGEYPIQSDLE